MGVESDGFYHRLRTSVFSETRKDMHLHARVSGQIAWPVFASSVLPRRGEGMWQICGKSGTAAIQFVTKLIPRIQLGSLLFGVFRSRPYYVSNGLSACMLVGGNGRSALYRG